MYVVFRTREGVRVRVRGPRTTTGRLYTTPRPRSAGRGQRGRRRPFRTAVCWCGVSPHLCVCGVFRPRVLARVQLNVTIQRHRVTTGLNLELLCPHHALSNRENFSSSRSLALELTISLSSSRPLALELLTRGAHVALVRRRRRVRLRRAVHRRRRIGASHNCRLLCGRGGTRLPALGGGESIGHQRSRAREERRAPRLLRGPRSRTIVLG